MKLVPWGLLLLLLPMKLDAGGPLELPVAEKNFGTAIAGQTVEAQFEIVNHDSTAIVVKPAAYGCPCFSAEPTTVPAKGRTRLHVRLETEGRQGFQQQSLRLHGPEPSEPLVITLVGEVLPAFRLAPQALQLDAESASHAKVEIHGPVPFQVLSCQPRSSAHLTVRCPREPAARLQELVVEVALPPENRTKDRIFIDVEAASDRFELELPVILMGKLSSTYDGLTRPCPE